MIKKKTADRQPVCSICYLIINFRIQIFTVISNYFLIPMEGFFSVSVERAVAVIIFIHINISVTFGHLACGHGYEVDRSPRQIAHQVYTVLDSFTHLLNMLFEIIDKVVIV